MAPAVTARGIQPLALRRPRGEITRGVIRSRPQAFLCSAGPSGFRRASAGPTAPALGRARAPQGRRVGGVARARPRYRAVAGRPGIGFTARRHCARHVIDDREHARAGARWRWLVAGLARLGAWREWCWGSWPRCTTSARPFVRGRPAGLARRGAGGQRARAREQLHAG